MHIQNQQLTNHSKCLYNIQTASRVHTAFHQDEVHMVEYKYMKHVFMIQYF